MGPYRGKFTAPLNEKYKPLNKKYKFEARFGPKVLRTWPITGDSLCSFRNGSPLFSCGPILPLPGIFSGPLNEKYKPLHKKYKSGGRFWPKVLRTWPITSDLLCFSEWLSVCLLR